MGWDGVGTDIIGLDISVDDSLLVYIPDRATQLGHPEPNSFFGEGLSGDVKS